LVSVLPTDMSHHERLDEAALHTIRVFGVALAGALVPALVFRRFRVLVLSTTFAAGVATGVSWRDACAILHQEQKNEQVTTDVLQEEHKKD
jgi:hypothetical protein